LYLGLQLWVHNTNFQSHYQINKYTFPICIFITTYLQSNEFLLHFTAWAMFLNTYTHAKKLYSCCFPSLEIKISVYHSIIYKVQTPWHFRSCKSNLAVNCKKNSIRAHSMYPTNTWVYEYKVFIQSKMNWNMQEQT